MRWRDFGNNCGADENVLLIFIFYCRNDIEILSVSDNGFTIRSDESVRCEPALGVQFKDSMNAVPSSVGVGLNTEGVGVRPRLVTGPFTFDLPSDFKVQVGTIALFRACPLLSRFALISIVEVRESTKIARKSLTRYSNHTLLCIRNQPQASATKASVFISKLRGLEHLLHLLILYGIKRSSPLHKNLHHAVRSPRRTLTPKRHWLEVGERDR